MQKTKIDPNKPARVNYINSYTLEISKGEPENFQPTASALDTVKVPEICYAAFITPI